MKPEFVIPAQNLLGESIVWDAEGERLLWSDIRQCRLFRYDLKSKAVEVFQTPEPLCSFGLVKNSDRLVAAFASGIGLYELRSQVVGWLLRPRFLSESIRFNDGRVDRQGRFWVGSMMEGPNPSSVGEIFRIGAGTRPAVLARNIAISNGLCWSPDSTQMYFADSALGIIFVYDFAADSGEISNPRIFAQAPRGAYPDGATVDSEGHLWSAHWGAGQVVRYAPDGTVDRVVLVPATQPTCVAFGGPDLRLLFISSARLGLDPVALARQPQSGDVFVYETPVPGLREPRFIVP